MNKRGTETGKRNTPIATLIKNFINKKSGKVSDSRESLIPVKQIGSGRIL